VSQVKITWKAFGDKPEQGRFVTSVELETEFAITDENRDKFLNVVYQQTNLYGGNLWNLIEPKLSPFRTHTSLSVGDEIEIDSVGYVVADFGFIKIEDADIQVIDHDGRKVVFSVREKVSQ